MQPGSGAASESTQAASTVLTGCLVGRPASRTIARARRASFQLRVSDRETPSKPRCPASAVYLEMPKSFMCCGLLAASSWSSRVPAYLPCLCGANSTERVHVPPFAAIVVHVLAVTLNGGVAAGAVFNDIAAGLSLISVML